MIQSWFDFEVIDYLFKAFNIISIDAFVSNELDIPFVLNTKNLLKVNLKIEKQEQFPGTTKILEYFCCIDYIIAYTFPEVVLRLK